MPVGKILERNFMSKMSKQLGEPHLTDLVEQGPFVDPQRSENADQTKKNSS